MDERAVHPEEVGTLPSVPAPSLRVLLVEDDPADAILVSELFADVGDIDDVVHVGSLTAATSLLGQVDCVLLDMNLPDSGGLDGLARLLAVDDHPAIVVLTGDVDETRGRAAVAAGAEDYLIKGRVDGQLLTRAVQYAVERRRADHLDDQLREARLYERENRRLGRGLLPTALLRDQGLAITTRYQPGARQMLLGGDFYDAVETDDGTVHLIIGDVSGHGPDEAAVGVSLRIAWRALVLAGTPAAELLPLLDKVFVTERHDPTLFTTAAMVTLAADRSSLDLQLAGHPPPVLVDGTAPRLLPDHQLGVPLGVRLGTTWPAVEVALPPAWALMLYTDGLIESRDGRGEVLWTDGLLPLLERRLAAAGPDWQAAPGGLVDLLLADVDRRTPIRTDDRALALLCRMPVAAVERVTWEHEPTAESCVRVRRAVRAFLEEHGVDVDTVDDAMLVAHELATNAVDHARTPYRVTLTLDDRTLRVEVADDSAAPPLLRRHDPRAARGRGLQMVDSLSARWTVGMKDGGKTVSADLTRPAEPGVGDGVAQQTRPGRG